MFRLSRYLKALTTRNGSAPQRPASMPADAGPVVIWNLIRRCNLTCKHCYATSADTDFKGELSSAEAATVMDDLQRFKVPVLILSGGEPLMRPDTSDPLMAGLKQQPRPLKGRCGICPERGICGGNTRTRAWQLTGDPWDEDPGCYLTDEELGIKDGSERLKLRPYERPPRPVAAQQGGAL